MAPISYFFLWYDWSTELNGSSGNIEFKEKYSVARRKIYKVVPYAIK